MQVALTVANQNFDGAPDLLLYSANAPVIWFGDVTTAARCSDFTAVSKLPLIHCPDNGSRHDTGCATGRKRQLSGASMTDPDADTECTARVFAFAPARPSAFAARPGLPTFYSKRFG